MFATAREKYLASKASPRLTAVARNALDAKQDRLLDHSGILKGSLQRQFGDNPAAYLNKCGRKVVSGGK